MAAAARVVAARAATAPRPIAAAPPRPGTAPDAALDAALDPSPRLGADPAPRGAAAATDDLLGQGLPLAPLAELAPRTWADEELRQLARRQVQLEREEEARQAAAASAAVAAARFVGQHPTPAAAARQAAEVSATATKFEHLVVRSAGAQSAIARALARGDATAAARAVAATTTGPHERAVPDNQGAVPKLGGVTRDFGRTFARRASLANPDPTPGADPIRWHSDCSP